MKLSAPFVRAGWPGWPAWLALGLGVTWPVAAEAASWSEAEDLLGQLEVDGSLPLIAGRALLIEPNGSALSVSTVEGERVPLSSYGDDLLVASSEGLRRLVFEGDLDLVDVRYQERRGDAGQWEAYERQVLRLLAPRSGVLDPARIARIGDTPWGGVRVAASIRLRALAVQDAGVARLGALADLELDRPASYPSHGETVLVVGQLGVAEATYSVSGPGLLRIGVQPVTAGSFVRFPLTIRLDGEPVLARIEGSTGALPFQEEVWLPPGTHIVRVDSAGTAATFTAETRALRGWTLAGKRRSPTAPAAQPSLADAEDAYLYGRRAASLEAFRQHLGDQGIAGGFARARVILLTDDVEELRALALLALDSTIGAAVQMPDGQGPDRDLVEITADAILKRGSALDPQWVLAAVDAVLDPDSEALAAWLDRLGGSRPRGLAWLARGADIPLGEDPRRGAIREAARATRWVRMAASSGAPGGFVSSDQWPGVPRAHIVAGTSYAVILPDVGHGRAPVLGVFASGPVQYRIDGVPHRSRGGDLTVALAAGEHSLAVDSGELFIPQASLVPMAPRTYDWQRTMLPATFPIPDAGSPVSLRVDAAGLSVVHLVLRTAAGAERPVDLDVKDGSALFSVAADEVEVRFSGRSGGEVGVAMRAVRDDAAPATVFEGDVAPLLASITRLSRAIDAAGPTPAASDLLLERAWTLAVLGQVSACRRDLAAVLRVSPDRREGVAAVAALLPDVRSATAPGPQSTAATFAAATTALRQSEGVIDFEVLATAADRASRLEGLGDRLPGAWLAAALEREAAGDLVRALDDARMAGEPGREVATRLSYRIRYKAVPRVDSSAGLVPVEVKPEVADRLASSPDGADPLWRRVRDAMFAAPDGFGDSAHTVILRGPGGDLAVARGRAWAAQMFCRSEAPHEAWDPGAGAGPCVVAVRFDDQRRVVQIADGSSARVEFEGSAGTHELEFSGPGDGYALLARVDVDNKPLPMRIVRNAIRVTPAEPLTVSLAGNSVVRVDVVTGSVSVTLGEGEGAVHGMASPAAPFVAPAPGSGPISLTADGAGEVFIYRGTFASAPAAPVALTIARSFPSPPIDVDAVLARKPVPESDALDEPGSSGSVRVGVEGAVASLPGSPGRSVPFAALTGEWLRTRGQTWLRVGGWAHLPVAGFSAGADGAWLWDSGFALGHVAVLGEPGSFGVDALLRVRHGVAVAPDWELRGRLDVFARPSFGEPAGIGDPAVWTRYRADHPFGARLDAGVVAAPTRDLRWEAGLALVTNAGASVDQAGPYVAVDLLPGEATWLGLDVRVPWKFADDDRSTSGFSFRFDAILNHAIWLQETRRLVLYARLGLQTETAPDATLGCTYMWTDHRGLRDLGPDAEPFQTSREAP
ncbi:MAG: hypothetical protein EXR69_10585 [Myxococcales bacterium]|nr:hypothetical protein [Myxococcales bacterium]